MTTEHRAGSSLPPGAYFRASALDVDGTLAEGGRLSADALYALGECRERGIAPILVTGRTVADLRARIPRLLEQASAVVAENGACVLVGGTTERTAPPLDPALGALLSAEGVPWSSGEVLLACSGDDEATVLAAVRDLGYEYQLVRNRGALMVLPAGVTKASGLTRALAWLGLSPHSTVGVGDGENDHSLLDTCELGVAVANAVESLKAYADLVLERPGGEGVAALLSSELLTGKARRHSKRWQVHLGAGTDGTPVTLPASQLNVIVAGASGDGKSYLAGLIAEQLVVLGYSIVVLDPEGDHIGLSRLPGVSVLDARAVPGAAGVLPLLSGPGRSALVALSGLDEPAQRALVVQLAAEIEAVRAESGLPHWVLVDEAHRGMHNGESTGVFEPAGTGRLLVTCQPGELSADVVADSDAIIAVGGSAPSGPLVDLVAAVSGVARVRIAELLTDATGRGLLVERAHPAHVGSFTLG